MFGHRPEGSRVRDVDPIVQITPYLMPMRCDAQVFLDYDVEYEPLMRYIAKKSREGVKITFMEILIASFVRGVSQVPEVNRFIMNKQFYNRRELTASFTLLMDTDDGSIEENTVKIFFDPTDTIYDVSARVKELVAKNRRAETSGFAVKLASAVLKIPLLPNLVVGLVKLLSCQKFRDGVRLELLCGQRALDHLSACWEQSRQIGQSLSVKPEASFAAVERMQSELLAARERAAGLEAQVFAHTAAEYAGKGDTVLITAPLEGDGVRRLCDAVAQTCGGRCAVFSGTDGTYRYALIHAGQDIRPLVKDMNDALHGRGGGRDGFAQGSAACTAEEIRAFFSRR